MKVLRQRQNPSGRTFKGLRTRSREIQRGEHMAIGHSLFAPDGALGDSINALCISGPKMPRPDGNEEWTTFVLDREETRKLKQYLSTFKDL